MDTKISTFDAAITLARLCLGPGLLVLPFATIKGGLIFSPLGLILIAAWNGLSCMMMIECRRNAEKLQIDIPSTITSTFSKVAYAGLGWTGVFLADFSMIVTLLGVCCLYQINFSTLLIDISNLHNYISIQQLMVISAFFVLPFIFAKDLSALSSMSLIGLLCIIINVSAVIIYGYILYGHESTYLSTNINISSNLLSTTSSNSILFSTSTSISTLTDIQIDSKNIYMIGYNTLSYFPTSISNASAYLGIAIFCFGICAFVFPIEESMIYKHDFIYAIIYSLTLVCSIYIIIGDYGSILYNHAESGIEGNILLNLPIHTWCAVIARITMAVVCILTYPLTFLPPATMIEKMISHSLSSISSTYNHQYHPTPNNYNNNHYQYEESSLSNEPLLNSSLSTTTTQYQGQQYQDLSTIHMTDTNNNNNETATYIVSDHLLPELQKNILRLLLVIGTTVCAAFVPCFGLLISLIGCFTITLQSFILPPLLHIQLVVLPKIQKQKRLNEQVYTSTINIVHTNHDIPPHDQLYDSHIYVTTATTTNTKNYQQYHSENTVDSSLNHNTDTNVYSHQLPLVHNNTSSFSCIEDHHPYDPILPKLLSFHERTHSLVRVPTTSSTHSSVVNSPKITIDNYTPRSFQVTADSNSSTTTTNNNNTNNNGNNSSSGQYYTSSPQSPQEERKDYEARYIGGNYGQNTINSRMNSNIATNSTPLLTSHINNQTNTGVTYNSINTNGDSIYIHGNTDVSNHINHYGNEDEMYIETTSRSYFQCLCTPQMILFYDYILIFIGICLCILGTTLTTMQLYNKLSKDGTC